MFNGEWTLTYPGCALSMGGNNGTGLPQPIYHFEAPDLGDINWNVEDAETPRQDGLSFGTDYHTGRVITFSLAIQAASEALALAQLALLAKAWRGDGIRLLPGAVAELATENNGRQRMIWGRPRRFGPPVNSSLKSAGLIFVPCDFQCAGQQFYALTEDTITVPFIPPPSGGFTFPITFPLSTVGPAVTAGGITVGGEDPAWPIITINGPITNPVAAAGGLWTLGLTMTIQAGQSVTIDTRPWKQTVTRQDGASFAGKLTRESRIDKAFLPPGPHSVSLGGVDGTGTSSMNFNWRNTYAGI